MSVGEFVTFWGRTRLASVGTVGESGWPHAAPVVVTLDGDRFHVPAFPDSVRMADLRRSPRLVITTWNDPWHAAIVYGLANVGDEPAGMVTSGRRRASNASRTRSVCSAPDADLRDPCAARAPCLARRLMERRQAVGASRCWWRTVVS